MKNLKWKMINDIWEIPWSTVRNPPLTGTRDFPFSILNFSFIISLGRAEPPRSVSSDPASDGT